MAPPSFINFSRNSGTIIDAVQRINDHLCAPWRCKLTQYAYVCRSDDPYEGGYEMDGEEMPPCESMEDVRALIAEGRAFCLIYLSSDTRANFYVHFTEIEADAFTVTIDVETSFIYYRNDEYERGQWFEAWLTSLAIAIGADICVYGVTEVLDASMPMEELLERLQEPLYEALDPATVLDRLRRGDLLALPDPGFHAISIDLIESSEIQSLVKKGPCAPRLVYRAAPGYHILANISFWR